MEKIPEIRFEKTDVDTEVVHLLTKLENNPTEVLIAEIKGEFQTAVKVFRNDILCGLLMVRGVIDVDQNFILVISHAIAADGINFLKVLKEENALIRWAENAGFAGIRQFAGTKAMCLMIEDTYDDIESVVYIKRLSRWKTNQTLAKNPAPRHPIKITELSMRAE